MTAADKKKAQFLAVLLVIAGLTWFLVYRTSGGTATDDTKKKGKKPPAAKAFKDPKIHSEWIQAADEGDAVGQKNIFQYRQKPLPPQPPPRPVAPYVPPVQSVGTTSSTPYVPPPPPFKSFKFDGLSTSGSAKNPKMLASLTDGANSYQVTLGECVMGQYCVRQLNENLIEIEDLVLKQRKTFPRTPSQ